MLQVGSTEKLQYRGALYAVCEGIRISRERRGCRDGLVIVLHVYHSMALWESRGTSFYASGLEEGLSWKTRSMVGWEGGR